MSYLSPARRIGVYDCPFNSKEAAAWLGLLRRQLLTLTRGGVIPAAKVGSTWRYSQRKLAEFAGMEEGDQHA